MFRRPLRTLAVLALMLTTGALGAIPAAAATDPPQPRGGVSVILGGECVAAPHSLNMSFSRPLNTTLQGIGMDISGTLTCAGDPVLHTLTLGLSGIAVAYTCAAGFSNVAGEATLSSPVFPDFVAVTIVGDGIHVHMDITGQHITGTGDFVWSTSASISGCASGQTSQTDLSGSITYVYT